MKIIPAEAVPRMGSGCLATPTSHIPSLCPKYSLTTLQQELEPLKLETILDV